MDNFWLGSAVYRSPCEDFKDHWNIEERGLLSGIEYNRFLLLNLFNDVVITCIDECVAYL